MNEDARFSEDDRLEPRPEPRPRPRPRRSESAPRSGGKGPLIAATLAIVVLVAGAFLIVFLLFRARSGASFGERQRAEQAQLDVQRIDNALAVYYVRHGEYPDSLEVLCEPELNGGSSILEIDDLIDPWGQPYEYDPGDPDPTTGRPRVYTITPRGNMISNW